MAYRLVTVCQDVADLVEDVRNARDGQSAEPRVIAIELLTANEEFFRRDLREIHDRSTFDEEKLRDSLTGGAAAN